MCAPGSKRFQQFRGFLLWMFWLLPLFCFTWWHIVTQGPDILDGDLVLTVGRTAGAPPGPPALQLHKATPTWPPDPAPSLDDFFASFGLPEPPSKWYYSQHALDSIYDFQDYVSAIAAHDQANGGAAYAAAAFTDAPDDPASWPS